MVTASRKMGKNSLSEIIRQPCNGRKSSVCRIKHDNGRKGKNEVVVRGNKEENQTKTDEKLKKC